MGLTKKQLRDCGLDSDDVVELTDHIGYMASGKRVDHNIWKVTLNGRHVAWLFKQPNSRLECVANFEPKILEGVRKACEILRTPPGPVTPHHPIAYPPGVDPFAVPGDDDGDDTETEDGDE